MSENRYAANLRLPIHTHERAYFSLLLRGRYVERWGFQEAECAPATLVFHPAGETHSDQFGGAGGILFNVEVGLYLAARNEDIQGELNERIQFRAAPIVQLCCRLRQEAEQKDSACPLTIEGLVLQMFAEILRIRAAPEPAKLRWMKIVLEYLHAHYSVAFTLGNLASIAGVHPVHLAKEFRRSNGCTVGKYVRRLRVASACHDLLASDAPVVDIAIRNGFADHSHLCRTLKIMTGLSPSGYRAKMRTRDVPRKTLRGL